MPITPKFAPKFVPKYSGPEPIERVVAGLCYCSFGMVGLLYLLLKGGRGNQSPFLQFNFLQSIVLGLISFLVKIAAATIANILGGLVGLISASAATVITAPLGLLTELIAAASLLLLVYGAIWAFLGKQPEIPLISKLVRQQMR